MSTNVAILKCNSYKEDEAELTVRKAIALIGGLDKLIKKGDKVLLKPNLLTASLPSEGITTHPSIVKAVIKCVQEVDGVPFVGDCSGLYLMGLEKIWETTGMKRIALETGAQLINLEKGGSEIYEGIAISNAVKEFNVIINLPKFKTHALTGISGSMKNLFGLVPGFYKSSFHREYHDNDEFSKIFVRILKIVKPALNIMDGIVGMEGDGPSAGVLRNVGVVLASTDCVAVDTVMVKIMGYDPDFITMLKEAYSQGFKDSRISSIVCVGDPVEEVALKNFKLPLTSFKRKLPKFVRNIYWGVASVKPVVKNKDCRKCNTCIKACPVDAISYPETQNEGFPKVNNKKCIECFCCYEVCPHKSIELKKNILLKLWLRRQEGKSNK